MVAIWDGLTTAFPWKWRKSVGKYKVEYVTLSGGRSVPAHLLVCPECNKLDLKTDIDTSENPFTARCSQGHEFKIDARSN